MKKQFYINLLLINYLFSFKFWKNKIISNEYERGLQKSLEAALKPLLHGETWT